MRGVLTGKPASKTACTLRFWPSSARLLKALVYQCVYTPHAVDRSRVYGRKRCAVVMELQIVKLLIQSTFTLGNRTKGPVYRQHPVWG